MKRGRGKKRTCCYVRPSKLRLQDGLQDGRRVEGIGRARVVSRDATCWVSRAIVVAVCEYVLIVIQIVEVGQLGMSKEPTRN